FVISYSPPIGHFNFAQIGHYYFALTQLSSLLPTLKLHGIIPFRVQHQPGAAIISKGKERTMNQAELLKSVEAPVNENIPEDLSPGDAVSVHLKIKEGNRERIQIFKGTVLYKRGSGNDASFTVRRVASNGIGVERNFMMRSPRIEKVVIERHTKVRRARLYFLRERTGKSARLKQRF
ncbi:MAG: 50S ribosomal protein L19, partial [Brevefilum sp.]|nr:50S ribosomal protein L19 [Brevefilum sp.]